MDTDSQRFKDATSAVGIVEEWTAYDCKQAGEYCPPLGRGHGTLMHYITKY